MAFAVTAIVAECLVFKHFESPVVRYILLVNVSCSKLRRISRAAIHNFLSSVESFLRSLTEERRNWLEAS